MHRASVDVDIYSHVSISEALISNYAVINNKQNPPQNHLRSYQQKQLGARGRLSAALSGADLSVASSDECSGD